MANLVFQILNVNFFILTIIFCILTIIQIENLFQTDQLQAASYRTIWIGKPMYQLQRLILH